MSGGDGRVIVLLRGVNVGGKNRLPMDELARLLEGLGLEDVETYIQSGNAVGRNVGDAPSKLGEALAAAIEERRGFRPRVLVIGADRLSEAVDANPFPEAADEPGFLHLFFLALPPPSPDLDSLAEIATASERFHLARDVFYIHTPDGFGRSKLAARVEKLLGVAATARNWRTVSKLREMVDAMP
ncbi:MAG TPA: DUF1697 domain-containing protein [Longimicrobiales bacterium]|nr:DUF1697 domain-containing protein [Longimicrobiales bacterium]